MSGYFSDFGPIIPNRSYQQCVPEEVCSLTTVIHLECRCITTLQLEECCIGVPDSSPSGFQDFGGFRLLYLDRTQSTPYPIITDQRPCKTLVNLIQLISSKYFVALSILRDPGIEQLPGLTPHSITYGEGNTSKREHGLLTGNYSPETGLSQNLAREDCFR